MTHLCLVSDQPVPNFLPAVDTASGVRPDRVVLAVSPAMRGKAQHLAAAIKARQIATETLDVPNPYDLHGLQRLFIDWVDARGGEDVILNVTGGTKPMAIAAQEAFRMAGKPVFYVSVESDEVLWMDPDRPAHRIEKNLTLKTFLQIHGYSARMNTQPTPPEMWRALSVELLRDAAQWQHALAHLNFCAMEAARADRLAVGHVFADGVRRWDEMLEMLYHNEISRERLKIVFRSPEARAFANGGWIEWQVLEMVRGLDGVVDPAANVEIADAQGNLNELDVAFLSRNRLFIVECKTKRLDRSPDDFHGPAAEAVYKLDSLRKAGGIRTKGILVSFMPVGDNHKHRAEAAGITVIDQAGLPRLKELLATAVK